MWSLSNKKVSFLLRKKTPSLSKNFQNKKKKSFLKKIQNWYVFKKFLLHNFFFEKMLL